VGRSVYRPGQIVWAKVPDRNGIIKPVPRPILVVMIHPTVRTAPVIGLAISTRPDIHPENDPIVEMPWDAQTGSCTGLFEWCAAVLLWPVRVEQNQIESVTGAISPELLALVGEKLKEARFWASQRR
jgi:hypothetical protein